MCRYVYVYSYIYIYTDRYIYICVGKDNVKYSQPSSLTKFTTISKCTASDLGINKQTKQ